MGSAVGFSVVGTAVGGGTVGILLGLGLGYGEGSKEGGIVGIGAVGYPVGIGVTHTPTVLSIIIFLKVVFVRQEGTQVKGLFG